MAQLWTAASLTLGPSEGKGKTRTGVAAFEGGLARMPLSNFLHDGDRGENLKNTGPSYAPLSGFAIGDQQTLGGGDAAGDTLSNLVQGSHHQGVFNGF